MPDHVSSVSAKALRRQKGGVAILFAILFVVVIGFAALGTEAVFLFVKHRQMQTAADAAAYSAAVAIGAGHPADYTLEAQAAASEAGFVNVVDGTEVVVNRPPLSGPHSDDEKAVEVIITQPQKVSLMRLYNVASVDVRARAVAVVGASGGVYCLLVLDSTAYSAATVTNNATVVNPDCGVGVNSSSSAALTVRNNAEINGPVSVVGGWQLSNSNGLIVYPVSSALRMESICDVSRLPPWLRPRSAYSTKASSKLGTVVYSM